MKKNWTNKKHDLVHRQLQHIEIIICGIVRDDLLGAEGREKCAPP